MVEFAGLADHDPPGDVKPSIAQDLLCLVFKKTHGNVWRRTQPSPAQMLAENPEEANGFQWKSGAERRAGATSR